MMQLDHLPSVAATLTASADRRKCSAASVLSLMETALKKMVASILMAVVLISFQFHGSRSLQSDCVATLTQPQSNTADELRDETHEPEPRVFNSLYDRQSTALTTAQEGGPLLQEEFYCSTVRVSQGQLSSP